MCVAILQAPFFHLLEGSGKIKLEIETGIFLYPYSFPLRLSKNAKNAILVLTALNTISQEFLLKLLIGLFRQSQPLN